MKMNKKGFTLMEMLIVIAIIAILIAIAIPTFTNALEKSRQRTDMANVRSLKSLVVASYMAQDGGLGVADANPSGTITCYLNKGGQSFTPSTPPADAVKLEAAWKDETYGKGKDGHETIYVKINCDNNGAIIESCPFIPGNAS